MIYCAVSKYLLDLYPFVRASVRRKETTCHCLRARAFSPTILSPSCLRIGRPNIRTLLPSSCESSTSPSSPRSSSITSSSPKSITPLKTSSGVACGAGLFPEKNDRGVEIAEERKAEASSRMVFGLRNGMEIKMYDLLFQASEAALSGEGYAGSQEKWTEIF